MEKKREPTNVKLGTHKDASGKKLLVRFNHVHLHRWRVNKESGREEASVQIMIPKANVDDYRLAKEAEATELANYVSRDGQPGSKFRWPVQDGDTLTDSKGRPKPMPGHWVMSAKVYRYQIDKATKQVSRENSLPVVVGIRRDAKGELIPLTEVEIKSGDWGRISLNLTGYSQGTGGIGCYVNFVQMVQPGDPLFNRKTATEEFGEFDDDDEDPLS